MYREALSVLPNLPSISSTNPISARALHKSPVIPGSVPALSEISSAVDGLAI